MSSFRGFRQRRFAEPVPEPSAESSLQVRRGRGWAPTSSELGKLTRAPLSARNPYGQCTHRRSGQSSGPEIP